MIHLGDITKINGAKAPAVEVVVGGSPCQDLSVAGKRAGLAGERSGLFMEQIRIIKEMRRECERSGANDIIPRFMVWENVPGAFSSNGGEDFRAVLEETARVVDPHASIPRPRERWTNSGAVMGNGWSIAWRVLDAQFWGVPQRRRRIALVADFGGYTAPEILFERNRLSRNTPPSGTPWKDFAVAIAERFGGNNRNGERETKGNVVVFSEETVTNRTNQSNPKLGDPCHTLSTRGASRSICIQNDLVFDARGNGDGDIAPTLTGDHQNRATDYTGIVAMATQQGGAEIRCDDISPTLTAAAGMSGNNQSVIALDRAAFNQGINAQYDMEMSEDGINSTLTAKGPSAICAAFKSRMGAKAASIGYAIDKAPTLSSTGCDESIVQFISGNVAGTLDASYSKGTGARSGKEREVVADGGTVRRLTPLECERLQGYPDGWTDIGDYTDTNGKAKKASDSARYKALGNSIALPPWAWVLERLSFYCEHHTMASLFDGIGGFPLIWETLNGEGSCLWASEIEEFPIAVTKRRFIKHRRGI